MTSFLASDTPDTPQTADATDRVAHAGDGDSVAVTVCHIDDLVAERGAAVLFEGHQIALFRIDDGENVTVHALDNHDPFGRANVLARGIVGDADGRRYVASPLHKQRFDLTTGECLDDPEVSVRVWSAGVADDEVRLYPS